LIYIDIYRTKTHLPRHLRSQALQDLGLGQLLLGIQREGSHGKSMGNPWEIHGKSMEIQGKSMENQWNIHRGTDSTMNNLFFNNQTEDSLGKCGYLATSTWISNDLTLVT